MTIEDTIEVSKSVQQLAGATDDALTILAKAILELADHEDPGLTIGTRNAVQRLAEDDGS